jgi:two-component system sensor histidine kinase VanS
LLLAAVWLLLLRYVPENAFIATPVPGRLPIRSDLPHVFALRTAAVSERQASRRAAPPARKPTTM